MASAADSAKQILFQSSLADVVRSLRNSRKSESETIQEALQEMKSELSSPIQHVKIMAVLKLNYFHMLGYSGEHGAFHIIEVMADPQFGNKRAGYIAASMIFHEKTAVLPLCTALVKRDLASSNPYEIGLGLYFLSCVCNPDLARDLVSDVAGLLSHSRPYVRKKAVLCLYKMFLHFPDALRITYPTLKEKIEDGNANSDSDPGVRGAVVCILCELARRNPQNFLSLVVPFFALLSSVHNNWTLIKVIKVFGHFSPHEPRLGKKLVDPITNLITTTHAKSVQYECIFAVANGMSKVAGLVKTAVDKMKLFVEDRDQNLKYLGLDAMSRLMRENPKLLTDQRDTLLLCLKDTDTSIRGKALQLISGIATRKTLVDTVNAMFDNATPTPSDEDWTNTVIKTIIDTVTMEDYANVQDFEWYCAVLLDLAQLQLTHFDHGALIEREFINVVLRVPAIRAFAVENLSGLLHNGTILHTDCNKSTQWRVLCAAAFLVGEFPQWIPNKKGTCLHLLQERLVLLPAELQGICVTAAGKVRDYLVRPLDRHTQLDPSEEDNVIPQDATTLPDVAEYFQRNPPKDTQANRMRIGLKGGLHLYLRSPHPDVVERALAVAQLSDLSEPIDHRFFLAEIQPVLDDAQKAIQVPEDLDLDTPFCDTLPQLVRDSDAESDESDSDSESASPKAKGSSLEAERKAALSEKERRSRMDEYYIKERAGSAGGHFEESDLPPVVELETAIPAVGGRLSQRRTAQKSHTMTRELAKPASYVSPKQPSQGRGASPEREDEATMRFKNINLAKPVGKDEQLPTIKPYVRVDPQAAAAAEAATAGDAAALETKRLAATRHFQVVDVADESPVHATFQVIEVKVRKDGGISLTVAVTAANAGDGHSLQDVTAAVVSGGASFVDAEGVVKPSIAVAPKIKPGSQATVEATLSLEALPESFSTGVSLTFSASCGKKSLSVAGNFPLICKYFMKDITESPLDYQAAVVPTLESAGCVAAAIPLEGKFDGARLVENCQSHLRLQVVNVFRDCVALCGQIVCRKSGVPQSYLAVLIKEEAGEGTGRQLGVTVRGYSSAHIEGIINEISALV